MSKNDGGSVFPTLGSFLDDEPATDGISLRAYIATNIDIGQTFPGILDRLRAKNLGGENGPTLGHQAKKIAELRVIAADALIEELERDQ